MPSFPRDPKLPVEANQAPSKSGDDSAEDPSWSVPPSSDLYRLGRDTSFSNLWRHSPLRGLDLPDRPDVGVVCKLSPTPVLLLPRVCIGHPLVSARCSLGCRRGVPATCATAGPRRWQAGLPSCVASGNHARLGAVRRRAWSPSPAAIYTTQWRVGRCLGSHGLFQVGFCCPFR